MLILLGTKTFECHYCNIKEKKKGCMMAVIQIELYYKLVYIFNIL